MDSSQDQNPVTPTVAPKSKNKKPLLLVLLVIIIGAGIGAWMLADKNNAEVPTQANTTEETTPVEGSASMTVSSDAQQVTVGKAVTFKVYVNPGETEVNAVGVNASYPTDSFEFVSISYEGSGFDIQAKEEVKDGAITIERGAAKNTSGETLVATITLKATKATSESGLTIEKDSKLIQSSNTKNILKTRQGAQIEVVEE